MDGWLAGWMERCLDGLMGGYMARWMDKWLAGWMTSNNFQGHHPIKTINQPFPHTMFQF